MRTQTRVKDAKSLIPRAVLVETLEKLSGDKKVTSNPDWPAIKKGIQDAIEGRVSFWEPRFVKRNAILSKHT